ncbi:MAG: RluA family pseudouridine synthase [Clostridiales bacterium]|nr:RluA family pseudouridine synthase [Clostridiales bacterium]
MQFVVSREEDGMRVIPVLLRHAEGISPQVLKKMLQSRDVRIDGRRTDRDEAVFAGQEIRAYLPKQVLRRTKALEESRLVYLDEFLCVIEKPQGLPCEDSRGECGDTAYSRTRELLLQKGEKGELILCHRLDVKTGGLLVFAREAEAAETLVTAFRTRTIEKEYECLVKGCPQKKEATLTGYLRKDAAAASVSVTDEPRPGAVRIETRYRVIEEGRISRLRVDLLTGRTHQIRAHLAHIGHPILGDDRYGDRMLNRAEGVTAQRLWAVRLRFNGLEGRLSYANGLTLTVPCPF